MPQPVKPNNNPAKADLDRVRFDPGKDKPDPVRDSAPDEDSFSPDRARGRNAPVAALADAILLMVLA